MDPPKFPPVVELEKDVAIVWDDRIASILYARGFFGKPLGLRKVKPGDLKRPLVLSLFDTLYLLKSNIIRVMHKGKRLSVPDFIEYASAVYEEFERKYRVYESLRKLGYVIRPGMKFGSDFVGYKKGPGFDHSQWVVHVEKDQKKLKAIEIVRAGRLAASVKKKYLIATLKGDEDLKYYSFDRVKI